MAQIGASKSVAVHMLGKLKTASQMAAIVLLLFDGVLFGVLDTPPIGYLADLRCLRAHDLVHGLLPQEIVARHSSQGAISWFGRRCDGAPDVKGHISAQAAI